MHAKKSKGLAFLAKTLRTLQYLYFAPPKIAILSIGSINYLSSFYEILSCLNVDRSHQVI